MKKSIALILALVLCLGIFAGCNADKPVETDPPATNPPATSGDSGETTPATDPAPTDYTFPAGTELTVIVGHDINDLPLDKFVEEATGLSMKWIPRGSDDEITAMMTQKVTPSLLYLSHIPWVHEMGRYGALVNLWEYRDIMPNFFAHFDAYGEEIKKDYMTSEDELYTAPIFLNGNVEHFAWMYRDDIFAELNLSVPTSWDELLDVCAALKAAYPESYPISFRNGVWGFWDFSQQFGVDYSQGNLALDRTTNTYYNSFTTDEARYMLQCFCDLIDKGYLDVAALSNGTADWVADMSSSKSFITFDKAFQLRNIEDAGQEVNPDFSLSWFHYMPFVESDLPYQSIAAKDYAYGFSIPSKCPDVELACRYLDWMYSEEGSLILSWGKEGESYGVDENGDKYFLEGYDSTYQARYQETGYIDMKATAATYSKKCQEMIFDTMAAAKEGGFYYAPTLVFNDEEQNIITTYQADWLAAWQGYWQKFLMDDLDIDDDAAWQKFKDDMAALNEAELIAAYNAAYARYLQGENA